MPEFQLNVGGAYPTWATLDAFTKGYLEAAFFADCPEGDEWENVSLADMHADAWKEVRTDCASFQQRFGGLLEQACRFGLNYDMAAAGRDFWYTRQGHGVGYWDRGLKGTGKALTNACGWRTDFPEVDFEGWFN